MGETNAGLWFYVNQVGGEGMRMIGTLGWYDAAVYDCCCGIRLSCVYPTTLPIAPTSAWIAAILVRKFGVPFPG